MRIDKLSAGKYNGIMEENKNQNYISLVEAAKMCSYSEPYLRLRARAGKLKSVKLGKKWMTTAEWLREYEARVAAWRQATEEKRIVSTAVLVSAPAELSENMSVPVTVETQGPEAMAKEMNDFSPRQQLQSTVRDLTDEGDDMPAVPSSRPLVRFASGSGQVLPVPQQSKDLEAGNSDYLVWFGAMIAGAMSALMLAVIVSGGNTVADIAATAQKFSQANANQAAILHVGVSDDVATDNLQESKIGAEGIKNQFSTDSLKNFVEEAANFIDNLDMPGW